MKLFDNVAVIPARGGSTSIPKKIFSCLLGSHYWLDNTASFRAHISRVIVSTDCEEIAKVAVDFELRSHAAKVHIQGRHPLNLF